MQTEALQKDLLAVPATTEVAQAIAYPIAPTHTHIVHVSSDLMPAQPYAMMAPARAPMRWVPILATAVLALGASYFLFRAPSIVGLNDQPVSTVTIVRAMKAPLDSCLIEQGVVETKSSVTITNPITATPVSLVSMVPYGTRVKKGEVVAKLDLTPLHATMADQQSKILAARTKLADAQEALDTLKVKNEGELSAADLQLEFAQVDLNKFQTEEKQVELNDRRGQIAMAERDLKEAEEKLQYYRTFHKRGFISSEQLKAKEAELDKTRFSLAQSQSRLKIYERYMVPRQERTLLAKVEELKRENQKLRKTQTCAVNKAQAEITTCRCGLTAEESKLTLLQNQLALAEVKAPCDGILAAPLAEAQKTRPSPGAALQPSQVIFTMPQMEQLCVKVRLGESDMKKLQAKQQARITIDSEDDIVCTGTLEKIIFKADTVWTKGNAQPRDFVAHIKICSNHPLEWTSLGQKARVEFTLETLPEALQLPANAITEKDGKSYVMVMTHDGPAQRELRTGCTDGKHVEIRHGLEAGDKVLLSTKLKPSDEPSGMRVSTATP
ncbi:MAG: hypothetical protein QM703_03970 [Gemmatales bacterium]